MKHKSKKIPEDIFLLNSLFIEYTTKFSGLSGEEFLNTYKAVTDLITPEIEQEFQRMIKSK